jgi:hypothetical protein
MATRGIAIAALAGVALFATQPWKRRAPATDSTAVSTPEPALVRDSVPAAATPAPEFDAPAPAPAPVTQPPAATQRAKPQEPERTLLPDVRSLRVTGPDVLAAGGSAVLEAAVLDSRERPIAGKQVRWLSSAPDVVSVTATGQVQARSPGRAVITATVEGVSQVHPITVRPEVVAQVTVPPAKPAPAPTESSRAEAAAPVKPPPAPEPAAPTEAERREQVEQMIAQYARALERRDMNRIRELYPAMPPGRERQLQDNLTKMDDLVVRLSVTQVQLVGGRGVAQVTGAWTYSEKGQRFTLPANDRYMLEERDGKWVIVGVQ